MKPSRSTAPIPTFTAATSGRRSKLETSRNGNSDCNCLIKSSPTHSSSTFLIRRNSFPRRFCPRSPVARLVLDRMPDNFFAETEQVAFMTQNVAPGIDFSNHPLLQGRNFSYLDTQRNA
jgi:hypothetical protein